MSQMSYQTLPSFRSPRARGRTPGSAYIAPDHRPLRAFGVSSQRFCASSESSSSNGSLNCTGSLYGNESRRSTRLPVREPLPCDAEQRPFGARNVIIAGFDPIRVAEIVLRKVAVQVLFATILVDPDHASLENRIE